MEVLEHARVTADIFWPDSDDLLMTIVSCNLPATVICALHLTAVESDAVNYSLASEAGDEKEEEGEETREMSSMVQKVRYGEL